MKIDSNSHCGQRKDEETKKKLQQAESNMTEAERALHRTMNDLQLTQARELEINQHQQRIDAGKSAPPRICSCSPM